MSDAHILAALAEAGMGEAPPAPVAPPPAEAPAPAQAPTQVVESAPQQPEHTAAYEHDIEPPAAQQTDSQPAPTPTPTAPAEHSATLQAILQQQMQLNQVQAQNYAAQMAELEARLQKYEQAKPAAEPQKQWWESIEVPELDASLMEQYKGSLPVINAVARQQALELLKLMDSNRITPALQGLSEQLSPLQESVQASIAQVQQAQTQSIAQTLNARLPWLEGAKGTQEYAAFYEATIPGSGGLTRKFLVEQALSTGNVDSAIDVLSGFKPPVKQNLAEQVSPGRAHSVPVSATAPSSKAKGMRLSDYNRAVADFQAGKMSPAQFHEIDARWLQHNIEGTAVMDN